MASTLQLLACVFAALVAVALTLRQVVGRETLHRTIFEADTAAGKVFDAALLVAIGLSVLTVCLESEPQMRLRWSGGFQALEWGFTLLFSLEYLLRLLCVGNPLHYARSFFGLVDLLAIAPTFLGLLLTGPSVFAVVRVLRLLRAFRVLKMAAYLREAEVLGSALRASRRRIGVFLLTMATLVVLIGALMYGIEVGNEGFRSIPAGIYWAVVTITTVGYGDVAPVTPLGRFLASVVMLIGYSILAVPTGILGAEIGLAALRQPGGPAIAAEGLSAGRNCPACGLDGHDSDAMYCKHCGAPLEAAGRRSAP